TSVPSAPVSIIGSDFDIETGPTSSVCDPNVAIYCAVAGTTFTVGAGRKIRAHGLRPLLLVAVTTFDLSGDIDVSSLQDGAQGAGAASALDCLNAPPPPTQPTGNSGGYGGTFGGKGSDGDSVNGMRGVASSAVVIW